jgi:hypothetical protein
VAQQQVHHLFGHTLFAIWNAVGSLFGFDGLIQVLSFLAFQSCVLHAFVFVPVTKG